MPLALQRGVLRREQSDAQSKLEVLQGEQERAVAAHAKEAAAETKWMEGRQEEMVGGHRVYLVQDLVLQPSL